MKAERYSKEPQPLASPPRTLPPGSCDCHGHIFPPVALYPTHHEKMPLAPVELYLDVHRHLGFERGVLVQGGAYRHDNRAMLEALERFPGTLRGVALVPGDSDDEALRDLKKQGVRALRFTRGGASRIEDLRTLAPAMRRVGLHAELFIGLAGFADLQRELLGLGIPLVLDHLAGPFETAAGNDQPGFASLLAALDTGKVWVKLSPQRNSVRFPGYEDVHPFCDALVRTRPDRLVWGSDWPFPHMSDATPDIESLLRIFESWVTDPAVRHAILVENPAALYGFA